MKETGVLLDEKQATLTALTDEQQASATEQSSFVDELTVYDVGDNNKERLETIVSEIKERISETQKNCVEIGKLLIEAKALHGKYGCWGKWLDKNFELSQKSAERLINIARGFENSTALSNLGLTKTKADILLRLDENVRENFIQKNDFESLSTRELGRLVREYNGEGKTIKKASKVYEKIEAIRKNIDVFLDSFSKNKSDSDFCDAAKKLNIICENVVEKLENIKADKKTEFPFNSSDELNEHNESHDENSQTEV